MKMTIKKISLDEKQAKQLMEILKGLAITEEDIKRKEVEEPEENEDEDREDFHRAIVDFKILTGSLADRKGWKRDNIIKYLDRLYSLCPSAVFDVLLREAAILADEEYEDHITDSDELYAISPVDFQVYQIDKDDNYYTDSVALFRSIAEAEEARDMVLNIMNEMDD